MATILLSAAGFVAGGSIGGTVAGVSMAVIGRAVGATLGQAIDQRLFGAGSASVETGRVDRFRLAGASEGTPMSTVYGRMRVAGQVIWATRFVEDVTTSGGGKGSPPSPTVETYTYSVSLAIALCDGEISKVGRVWADGVEVDPETLNMRVYTGSWDQDPDPKIVAVEGAENTPAYRGTAYVVFDTLQLAQFGNRVPQFNFEVVRPSQSKEADIADDMSQAVQAVAIIPGTGEYALATTPVRLDKGLGKTDVINVNSVSGKTDFALAIDHLTDELPSCGSNSLVVSWFGDDLRCGECEIKPMVDQKQAESTQMPWRVAGLTRQSADQVPRVDGQAVYGGTPTDQSVVEAISHLSKRGQDVVFYPFILMNQLPDNVLPNPYDPNAMQPELPWRGRITSFVAPNVGGSTDQTAALRSEVDAFFGTAQVSDFSITGGHVNYSGPNEWSYRRFIFHNAFLCKLAGGVDAFCIGSEMRGLTQLRDDQNLFPAVEALIDLAADVRSILGADTKIGYAADWSEYFGYHPQDGTGDVYFHLDPLWANENIDFIGIDNYMPLSDWRDGQGHLDADWGSIYNLDYLKSNIEGGEGFEWYYHSSEARAAQIRTDISDGTHDEPWVFRYKDLRNWWQNDHHNRIDGVRQEGPTEWVPESKPFWFTEIGCAATKFGTNQPNAFVDVKSSESKLPYFSDGSRDDFIQMQYLRAMHEYWSDLDNNPVSDVTGIQMLDVSRSHVWAWDARSFPYFPNRSDLWSDGDNYYRGHWITGRSTSRSLASVVREICASAGVDDVDTSRLYGTVRGYTTDTTQTARSALQPLMVTYGFDAIERDGTLHFVTRDGVASTSVHHENLVVAENGDAVFETMRQPAADVAGRVRFSFVESDRNFEVAAVEAITPDEATISITKTEYPLSLTKAEARQTAERWLAESRIARDGASFALPPSKTDVRAGDTVAISMGACRATYRVDHVDQTESKRILATKVDKAVYDTLDIADSVLPLAQQPPSAPVLSFFMDLPLMRGNEVPHAPHLAVTAAPWVGSAAVYASAQDADYRLNSVVPQQSIIGETLSDFGYAGSGLWDRRNKVVIKLVSGALESKSDASILSGANLAAIGNGAKDDWELVQFTTAELIAPDTYELSGFLRGQQGTERAKGTTLPAGSFFVLMNGAPIQIDKGSASRGIDHHYRIGPAAKAYSDPVYSHLVEHFDGNGDRPYAPVHLSVADTAGGHDFNWVRRTRVGGDTWETLDAPLGEATELYQITVTKDGTTLRDVLVNAPNWTYTNAEQAADGAIGSCFIEVAQVSEVYGAGRRARVEVDF